MTVHYLFQDHSFDAGTTQVMGQAFDRACVALGQFGRVPAFQEIMAKRIIEAAKQGERNSDRLCKQALQALTNPESANQLAAKARTKTNSGPTLRSRA